MTVRSEILTKIRDALARPDLRFPPRQVEPLTPETRMTVTSAPGNKLEQAKRYGAELEKLHGSFQIVESTAEARLAMINKLMVWVEEEEKGRKGVHLETGQERRILSWHPDALPIAGLDTALADLGFQLVVPNDLRMPESRDAIRYIRFGVTGVEAAFAATGSLLVGSGPQTSRVASLLPFRHIALIPLERLYPTVEDWLHEQRQADKLVDFYRNQANLAMISGPSKSADIEMNLTLGVHGPKFLHAILFGKME